MSVRYLVTYPDQTEETVDGPDVGSIADVVCFLSREGWYVEKMYGAGKAPEPEDGYQVTSAVRLDAKGRA